jgi:hypothetical protein
MFEYWSQTYRVHNLEWSQEKAADILHAWQRKFTQVCFFFLLLLLVVIRDCVYCAGKAGGPFL